MKKTIFYLITSLLLLTCCASTARAQTTFYRNLSYGSSGSDVVQLQNFLISSGFLNLPTGVNEGYFGRLTVEALGQYQISKGIQPSSGYFGPVTRMQVIEDEASVISTPIAAPVTTMAATPFVCPAGFNCTTATSTSLSVTGGSVGFPIFTTGNIIGTYSSGSTAATWIFTVTLTSTSSVPLYVSATPNAAVQIVSDLSGVPGVSGLAAGTMPLTITPSNGILPGDTNSGSGITATGSYIVPPNSTRTFIVTVIENNYNNPSADGGASIELTGVYYNSSPIPSGTTVIKSSEALCTTNLSSLHSAPVTLQGNGGAEFYAPTPNRPY